MNAGLRQTRAKTELVISCEHGGNEIPAPYQPLFQKHQALLESHRGFDHGALVMARALAGTCKAPLLISTTSRLLVDLNRSVRHRKLHLEDVAALSATTRQAIVEQYHKPHRADIERLVSRGISRGAKVVHICCHSFIDVLDGEVRKADIGLLYDPARHEELALCAAWKACLKLASPHLAVRRNYPYEGRNDGLTTSLRKLFPSNAYLGIELELNQKNLLLPPGQWAALRRSVIASLSEALSGDKP